MYTAGELAKNLGVSARTVRFYDEKGILSPVGYSEAGYRIYDETSVEKLRRIVELTREREFVIEQYRSDENFTKRVNIHDYSTAEIGFFPWMLEKLNLGPGMKILEIGCGNALFWKTVAPELPEDLEIHLTDYSEGMLSGARKTMEELQAEFPEKRLRFVVEKRDAENFTYPVHGFDRIMANHLLYHLKKENRPSLYSAIQDLLKEDGVFSCSLIGREHNRELHQFMKQFDPQLTIPLDTFDIFLENAQDELKHYFTKIKWWEQENNLLVPDAGLIYDYASSYSKENAERLKKNKEQFLECIEKKKNDEGCFFIHKATGVVVCSATFHGVN